MGGGNLIGDKLNVYTFDYLIDEALGMISEEIDKRQGSIVYDTLAVGDVQLAKGYIALRGYYLDSYALTAEGEYLDLRCQERGVHRYPDTPAVKLGVFKNSDDNPVSVPMGARFSTESDSKSLIYRVSDVYKVGGKVIPGAYTMTCETLGSAGNDYTGKLIRITNISGMSSAIMTDLLIPGRDQESDEAYRARYIEYINRPPFGGNVAHYKQWIMEIDGVGAVQVYPIWNGGGTVKCSIVGADFMPANPVLIDKVQTVIDPEQNRGIGLGTATIGAIVTIVTPETKSVDIAAKLTLEAGVTIGQVQSEAKTAIASYLTQQRKNFGKSSNSNSYFMNIYRAQISAILLDIAGILNVTDVKIDGVEEDMVLPQTAEAQHLPILGEVSLGEV